MTSETHTASEVQREMLRLALHNAARTVPLQLVAVAVLVGLGLHQGQVVASIACGAIGLLAGLWRFLIGRRYAKLSLDDSQLNKALRHLEGNAVLAGLMWVVATFGIYPALQGRMSALYVAFVFGSIATAAFFMTLAGRSFAILTGSQLGALIIVSLLTESTRSIPLAVLSIFFGLTAFRAAGQFSGTTRNAIQNGLEAKAANVSLKEAKEAADAANIAKSQFLATMSHEIRTPMNGVLGALDLLRHSKLDAEQRRLVKTAMLSGESLMTILNDVLDHSKIEAGMLTLQQAPLSLHAVASSVVALFGGNAEAKGIELRLDLEDEAPNWVIGDAQRLKQVLLNLVGNAIKFTEHGSVALRLTRAPATADRAGVAFAVRDSGIGIAPDALARLFRPFQQIDGSRNRRRGGTGLGLAISQRIVEAMGSRIEVESAPGGGSLFHFVLSLERDAAPPPTAPDSGMGTLHALLEPEGTVLLVEDNPVNRIIGGEMLRSLGLSVVEAEHGAAALEQLGKQAIDLVLMDCQMPVMDGYTAAQRIREREARLGLPQIPIVALTADAFDEDVAQALAAGMNAHLSKPYTRGQLRELLGTWL